MSRVIHEKIETMTNILETVDEGIIVIDEGFQVIEANHKLLKLLKIESIQIINKELNISQFFQDGIDFLINCFSENSIENYFTRMISSKNNYLLVKISSRAMPVEKGQKKR